MFSVKCVEEGEAESAVGEGEGLVLRVDIEKARREGLEERQLHGGVVSEGTALAGGQDFAAENEEVVIVDISLIEERFQGKAGDVEASLDNTLTILVGQHGDVGALTQQQP